VIKTIREGALGNPWFFRIIMVGIAAVFAVSMGWWGFGDDERRDNAVAKVNEVSIQLEDYQRSYRRISKFYRDLFQDKYDDEKVRGQVIDELVNRKLWAQEATRMGIKISDAAFQASVLSAGAFQKDGEFDSELYKRFLSFERLSSKHFEETQKEALLVEKVKQIVKDGVALTPIEIKNAEEGDPETIDIDREIESRLSQKQERAVAAYALSLRTKANIQIDEEQL
jgi:hypothetical protein